MTLWHYTCQHGRNALGRVGVVKPLAMWNPRASARLGPWDALGTLSWFTDLETPVADALGLTSRTIECDRTAYRYRVLDATHIVRWLGSEWRARYPELRSLEIVAGALPMHWYVSGYVVPVELDEA